MNIGPSRSQPQSLSDKTVGRQSHIKLIGIPFVWVSASGTASVFGQEGEGPEYAVAGERAAGLVFDEWQIRPGDSIPAKIEEGLDHSRL